MAFIDVQPITRHGFGQSEGVLTVKKRQQVTVRIEQQPNKQPKRKEMLAAYIKRYCNREMLISAGALAVIIVSANILIYGTHTAEHVETDVNASVVETIDVVQPVALIEEPLFPQQTQLKVGKGDTLLGMLTNTGVTHEEAFEAVAAIRKIYDPRRINSGQELDVTLEASDDSPKVPSLSELKMPISGTATIELHKIENGQFVVKKVEVPVTAHPKYSKLSIEGSLYQTARKAGLSAQMIMELMKGLSYDVDFQRDVRRGHVLEVVVDELKRDDGKVVGARNLRFAKLTLGRKKVAVYRYTNSKDVTAYYNAKGQMMRKTFMRTPVDGARMSSGYGMRKHPILGYNKMHKGVDFAAPTGTPIYAAGDGTVTYVGRRGGYGKYVRIKHNGKYSTAYAHISRYAKGLRKGKRVRQGQVIAYVGSTGRSTGPHLHYEVLRYGKQINPRKVQQFNTGTKLTGKELKRFKVLTRDVEMVMANADKPAKVASNTKTPNNG